MKISRDNQGGHCVERCLQNSESLEFPSQNFSCSYPSVRQESQTKKVVFDEKLFEFTVKDFPANGSSSYLHKSDSPAIITAHVLLLYNSTGFHKPSSIQA